MMPPRRYHSVASTKKYDNAGVGPPPAPLTARVGRENFRSNNDSIVPPEVKALVIFIIGNRSLQN
jgi:hypothetical protein